MIKMHTPQDEVATTMHRAARLRTAFQTGGGGGGGGDQFV